MNQKGSAVLYLIIGLLIAGGLFGVYYLGKSQLLRQGTTFSPNPVAISQTPLPTTFSQRPQASPSPAKEQWQKYESGALIDGLSFQYPQGWTVNYKREYNLSSDYTAKYRLTFDFAPPEWKNPKSAEEINKDVSLGIDWLGWGQMSFDVYDPQANINKWISKYESDSYKNKLMAKEDTKVGNKPTFLVSVNPQYSEQMQWLPRDVILGNDYSYEFTFSEGYFKDINNNCRTILRKKILPGININ